MWIIYELKLHVDRLVGGIPKHPTIIKRWQEAHMPPNPERVAERTGQPVPTVEQATEKTMDLLGSQMMDPEEVVQGIWTGFVTMPNGTTLALENRNIKAMLKESANIVRVLPDMPKNTKGGAIPLKNKLAERVFVNPPLIAILDEDGKQVTEPESSPERPIHVMTMQGPRTALKRVDQVRDVTLVCQLKVLDDGVITEDMLRIILDHAKENGLGTDRSTGAGTFEYELKRMDPPQ